PAVELVARAVRRADRGGLGLRRLRRDPLLYRGRQGAGASRLSPIVAGLAALAATAVAYRITARSGRREVTRGFRAAQVVSASMVALAHGTNDAQKTMGVITLALITVGLLPAHAAPPLWVVVLCGLAIAAGT